MSLPKLNVGARLNIPLSSSSLLCNSFCFGSISTSGVIVRCLASSTVSCSASTSANTKYVCKPTGESEGTASLEFATPTSVYVRYIATPAELTCAATVSAETIVKSGCLCTATVTATSNVKNYALASTVTDVLCFAKLTKENEFYIAASNSPLIDRIVADYVCYGISDQALINAVAASNPIVGLTLMFAPGLFVCDDSIIVKNTDMIGYGADHTVFEFSKFNSGIVARTTNVTNIGSFSITGCGSLQIIYDDPTVFDNSLNTNKFVINNINATNLKYKSSEYENNGSLAKIMIKLAYPNIKKEPLVIPKVYLELTNCNITDTDSSGFMVYGDLTNYTYARIFKDIYIYNCHARRCGMRERGSTIAGFHLLENISAENVRIVNSTAMDNWHSGFYFDDAKTRTFIAYNKKINESNIVKNIYIDNCQAYNNGWRSMHISKSDFNKVCSGFVLREFGKGSDVVESVADFITIADYERTVTVPTYPEFLGEARGFYGATTPTKVAYGNVTNCISSGNRYAGFYSRGAKQNAAELNLQGCYSSECSYAFAFEDHDGIKLVDCVSGRITAPTVMLNNIDTITVDRMRIDDDVESFVSFTNRAGYEVLPLGINRLIEVIG